jgi:PAS domain S-box-containing protein
MSADVAALELGERLGRPISDGDVVSGLLRQLVDGSPFVAVVATAPDFRIVYANAAAHGAARVKGGALVGRPLASAYPFLDPDRLAASCAAHVTAVEDGCGGEAAWWDVTYTPLSGAGPATAAVLIIAVDVTSRVTGEATALHDTGVAQKAQAVERDTEERLRAVLQESEDRLRLALESAGLGSWEYEAATGTTIRSSRHDAIFGYETPVADWSYERFASHIAPADRPTFEEGFLAALHHAEDWNVDCRMIRADGRTGWLNVRARPQLGIDGKVKRLLGTVADITERKRAEEALAQTAAKFESFA